MSELFVGVGPGGELTSPWYAQDGAPSVGQVGANFSDVPQAVALAGVAAVSILHKGEYNNAEPEHVCDGGVECYGKILGEVDPRNGGRLVPNGTLACRKAKPRPAGAPRSAAQEEAMMIAKIAGLRVR